MSTDLPTMDEVLSAATARYSPDVLTRALAERDRQVAEQAGAQALRDAADAANREWLRLKDGPWGSNPTDQAILAFATRAADWLLARADSAALARPTTDDRPVDMARAEEWVREAIENAIPDDLPGWRERYTDKAVHGVMAVLTAALASRPTTPTPTVSEERVLAAYRAVPQTGGTASVIAMLNHLGVAVTTDGGEG